VNHLTPNEIADLRIEADKGDHTTGSQLHLLLDAYELVASLEAERDDLTDALSDAKAELEDAETESRERGEEIDHLRSALYRVMDLAQDGSPDAAADLKRIFKIAEEAL
jgi:predicted  nucleic acid-binding Zn-ribbon protein